MAARSEPSDAAEVARDGEGTRPDRLVLSGFAVTIFASALLIFLVQPLVAKRILPWFGGAAAVWTLCLAFYQTTLFAGYAYAHGLIRFVPRRRQQVVHAAVIAAALLALPILPGESWRPEPGDRAPSLLILAMLSANVGFPFLVLAATGPLAQAWFARAAPGRSPYPLYAVSNLGSLLAVVAYPFLIEPNLGVSDSGAAWSWAFVATAAAVLGCAGTARRAAEPAPAAETALGSRPIRAADAVLWLMLSSAAVMLLMGVTNELCLDLASVPFLWIVPLSLYLVTFVLCFGYARVYRRAPWLLWTAAVLLAPWLLDAAVGVGAGGELRTAGGLPWFVLRYCGLLFGGCMLLHGELYRLRPPSASLTAFYLWVAAGGAIGGLFVGLLAPLVLDAYYELPLALAVASPALLAAFFHDERGWLSSRGPRWRRAAAVFVTLAALAFGATRVLPAQDGVVQQERTFFGVLRVTESALPKGAVGRSLSNGSTLHGIQRFDHEDRPTSYYGVDTGIGLLFGSRRDGAAWNVGALGLGVGTLAAYAREGDRLRFYEIDPVVARLAGADGYFTYLERSPADVEIVPGDGRLSLAAERRAGEPRFDLLVLDAYSSDAVPVHLLTIEAVELYADRVKDDGLLAFHLSNRFFRLPALVGREGAELGWRTLLLKNPNLPHRLSRRSTWLVLGRDEARLRELGRRAALRWKRLGVEPELYEIRYPAPRVLLRGPLWTDDYSNLFSVLRPAALGGWLR